MAWKSINGRLPARRLVARRMALALWVAALAATGCGGSSEPKSARSPGSGSDSAQHDPNHRPAAHRAPPELIPARCPDSSDDCQAATGRVIYAELVDPDGDGDLHVVLIGAGSLSAPGLTVLDVRRGLRPDRDPRIGDLVTGAGPVQRGSYGQRQIHVEVFRAAR
ncbi:MAG TPA: hypothetical protein VGF04_01265 [Solirubrobacterales bacterium]